MTTWLALLRGVNLGKHNKVPMAELRPRLTEAGLGNVRTYIQSGNVIVDSDETDPVSVGAIIRSVIEREFGVSYHSTHVGRLLHALGFSCQKPKRRSREQDPEGALFHLQR